MVESVAEKQLGGAVVWGGVEGVDTKFEGAGDDGLVGHAAWVVDVLDIKGGSTEDERGDEGGNGRARRRSARIG